jgi:hypothetical protein
MRAPDSRLIPAKLAANEKGRLFSRPLRMRE